MFHGKTRWSANDVERLRRRGAEIREEEEEKTRKYMKGKVITIEVTEEEVDALEDIFFTKLSEEDRKQLDDAKLSLWKKIATAFDHEEGVEG